MTNQSITQRLANPTRFMALSGRLLPWLWGAAAVLIAYGLWLTFFRAPPDYQQGETVKIMFIHVPSAWLAMGGYLLIAISSFGLLVFRHPLADVSAKAAAPIGAAFTLLALVTGSLWGKPMWGAYWVWDARLTSVLILFFLYLGLMALRSSIEEEALAAKLTAILGLVGVVDPAGDQVLGRLVEHAAPAGERHAARRRRDPFLDPAAAAGDGGGLHRAVRRHAHEGDAQRDHAPPRQGADAWPRSSARHRHAPAAAKAT